MTLRSVSFLKGEIARLEGELSKLKSELFASQCASAGVAVGDIVLVLLSGKEKAKGWQEMRVTKVDFITERPWVSGNLKTKSGSWSKSTRNAHGNWKRVGEAAASIANTETEVVGAVLSSPKVPTEAILAATGKAG